MRKTIVAFGELLWDLLPSGAVLGGAPGNFAYRINSLGHRGLLVSRLGRDSLGQSAAQQLVALGMDTSYLQWDDRSPTGTVRVQIDARGNPDFFIVAGVAYDQIECTDALLGLGRQADCLCFGTLVQRAPQSRATLRQVLDSAGQALKLLDINLRKDCYSTQTITESVERADIVKLNESEAAYLAKLFQLPEGALVEFAEGMLRRWKLRHCLITLGEQGAFLASSTGERVYAPGYSVPLVDTCGSGDAFSAGFLHGLLSGQPAADCLRWGNALGAIVAGQRGATEPISLGTIQSFLATQRPVRVEPSLEHWAVE